MHKDFAIIRELELAIQKKTDSLDSISHLSIPKLTDLTYIPLLYRWCREIADLDRISKKEFKRRFMFIVFFLYSPSVLAGDKRTINGIRCVLAEILDYHAPSAISNSIPSIIAGYKNYADFRVAVGDMYTRVLERLEGQGIIVGI